MIILDWNYGWYRSLYLTVAVDILEFPDDDGSWAAKDARKKVMSDSLYENKTEKGSANLLNIVYF